MSRERFKALLATCGLLFSIPFLHPMHMQAEAQIPAAWHVMINVLTPQGEAQLVSNSGYDTEAECVAFMHSHEFAGVMTKLIGQHWIPTEAPKCVMPDGDPA